MSAVRFVVYLMSVVVTVIYVMHMMIIVALFEWGIIYM